MVGLIPVSDYEAALAWYETLFGAPPSFFPNDIEAVWEVAELRSVYILKAPDTPETPCSSTIWTTASPRLPGEG